MYYIHAIIYFYCNITTVAYAYLWIRWYFWRMYWYHGSFLMGHSALPNKWYRIHFLLEYTLINWYRVIKEHDTNAYLLRICLIIWWRRKTELSVWHYFVFRRFDAYWIFPASIFLVLLALNLALIMLWVIYVLWHSLKTLSNREIFFGLAVILFRLLTI